MQKYSEFSCFNVFSPAEFVAHVEINRPKSLNSFTPTAWKQLRDIFNLLSLDRDVRVIVLSGAGDRGFTAGLDLTEETFNLLSGAPLEEERLRFYKHQVIKEFQDSISAIENCRKPVIGVAHGISYGLAIDILSAADVRICASNVRFSIKEVDIGLAADIGTLQRLPKIVSSQSWVKELAYTARDFGAAEAERYGFVSYVLEDKQQALAKAMLIAGVIAKKSPVAVQGSKTLINYSRGRPVQEGLDYTAAWNAFALGNDMFEAAMAAKLRKPVSFEKL
ncbi:enoyl-CoA hydratase/isomerase family protein [Myxozyma melibiosi]|uniref:Enoyl-CoA hydratase/isomerase family protein n=1 Tax=Myxozyma melibiosi TaxID=54550 RepID=A0ABR1FBG1_9ASCO